MRILKLSIVVAALAAVALPAQAQRRPTIRVQMTRAPSNNNSDNTGPNVGSSSGMTGDTFNPGAPGNGGNGAGAGAPAEGGGTPNSAGVTVTSTGTLSGAITTPVSQILSGLQSGTVTLTSANGATITLTVPPSVGSALAAALGSPSVANGQVAAGAVAAMLMVSNVPSVVVNAVSNAVGVAGGASPGTSVGSALGQAVSAVRSALAAGTVTPDAAKGLTAVLVALRAAVSQG